MAYEKQTWECGDVVTAEKLNHIEDGIAEASGGGTPGYECVEGREVLFEGENEGSPTGSPISLNNTSIIADTLIVTLNGAEYELPKKDTAYWGTVYGETNAYGVPTYTNYPCAVAFTPSRGTLFCTQTQGTYQVKIEQAAEMVTTTDCFEKVVNKLIGSSVPIGFVERESSGGMTGNFTGFAYEDVASFDKAAFLIDVNNMYKTYRIYALSSKASVTSGDSSTLVFTSLNDSIVTDNGDGTYTVSSPQHSIIGLTSNNQLVGIQNAG